MYTVAHKNTRQQRNSSFCNQSLLNSSNSYQYSPEYYYTAALENLNLNQAEHFERIVKHFQNVGNSSSHESYTILRALIAQLSFFQDLEKKISSSQLTELFQKLYYYQVPAQQAIYQYGGVPEQYYILLRGEAFVLLKSDLSFGMSSGTETRTETISSINNSKTPEKKRKQQVSYKRDKDDYLDPRFEMIRKWKKLSYLLYGLVKYYYLKLFEYKDETESSSPVAERVSQANYNLDRINEVDIWRQLKKKYNRKKKVPEYQKKSKNNSIDNELDIHASDGEDQDDVYTQYEVLEKYSDFRIVARYRTGEGFGEQALIKTGGRYTASVVAKNVCHLLTLDRALYVQLLAKAHEATLKEKLNYMLNFAIFAPINTKMVNLLCCFHSRLAKRGEYIYRYGTRVHGLYFVVEGEVEIETQEIVESNTVAKAYPQTALPDEDELALETLPSDIDYDEYRKCFRQNAKIVARQVPINRKSNRSDSLAHKNSSSYKIILGVLGKGTFFGEEELLSRAKTRYSSARAVSAYVQLYVLSAEILSTLGKYNDLLQRLAYESSDKYSWRQKQYETCLRVRNGYEKLKYLTSRGDYQYLRGRRTGGDGGDTPLLSPQPSYRIVRNSSENGSAVKIMPVINNSSYNIDITNSPLKVVYYKILQNVPSTRLNVASTLGYQNYVRQQSAYESARAAQSSLSLANRTADVQKIASELFFDNSGGMLYQKHTSFAHTVAMPSAAPVTERPFRKAQQSRLDDREYIYIDAKRLHAQNAIRSYSNTRRQSSSNTQQQEKLDLYTLLSHRYGRESVAPLEGAGTTLVRRESWVKNQKNFLSYTTYRLKKYSNLKFDYYSVHMKLVEIALQNTRSMIKEKRLYCSPKKSTYNNNNSSSGVNSNRRGASVSLNASPLPKARTLGVTSLASSPRRAPRDYLLAAPEISSLEEEQLSSSHLGYSVSDNYNRPALFEKYQYMVLYLEDDSVERNSSKEKYLLPQRTADKMMEQYRNFSQLYRHLKIDRLFSYQLKFDVNEKLADSFKYEYEEYASGKSFFELANSVSNYKRYARGMRRPRSSSEKSYHAVYRLAGHMGYKFQLARYLNDHHRGELSLFENYRLH